MNEPKDFIKVALSSMYGRSCYSIDTDWLIKEVKITRYREIIKKIIIPAWNIQLLRDIDQITKNLYNKTEDKKLKMLLAKKIKFNEEAFSKL